MYKKLQESFFNCRLNILVLNIKLIEVLIAIPFLGKGVRITCDAL